MSPDADPALPGAPPVEDNGRLSFTTVMKEIVRLAHTPRFHDKEVQYIVWANQDALSKLVSPKKPSFERGGGNAPDAEVKEVDFSGKMTPAQAQKAMESGPKSALEIRR